MPIRSKFDHAKKLVTSEAEGVITLQELMAYLDELVTEGAMPYAKLFNAGNEETQIGGDDLMVIAARSSAYAAFDPRGPLALVAKAESTREVMRRFMNLAGNKRPVMMFRRVGDALNWLEDPKID